MDFDGFYDFMQNPIYFFLPTTPNLRILYNVLPGVYATGEQAF
jgi:hypothetical protein